MSLQANQFVVLPIMNQHKHTCNTLLDCNATTMHIWTSIYGLCAKLWWVKLDSYILDASGTNLFVYKQYQSTQSRSPDLEANHEFPNSVKFESICRKAAFVMKIVGNHKVYDFSWDLTTYVFLVSMKTVEIHEMAMGH